MIIFTGDQMREQKHSTNDYVNILKNIIDEEWSHYPAFKTTENLLARDFCDERGFTKKFKDLVRTTYKYFVNEYYSDKAFDYLYEYKIAGRADYIPLILRQAKWLFEGLGYNVELVFDGAIWTCDLTL